MYIQNIRFLRYEFLLQYIDGRIDSHSRFSNDDYTMSFFATVIVQQSTPWILITQ